MGRCRTRPLAAGAELDQGHPLGVGHLVEGVLEERAAVAHAVVAGDRLGAVQVAEGDVVEALEVRRGDGADAAEVEAPLGAARLRGGLVAADEAVGHEDGAADARLLAVAARGGGHRAHHGPVGQRLVGGVGEERARGLGLDVGEGVEGDLPVGVLEGDGAHLGLEAAAHVDVPAGEEPRAEAEVVGAVVVARDGHHRDAGALDHLAEEPSKRRTASAPGSARS
jgi:hypothetical protein